MQIIDMIKPVEICLEIFAETDNAYKVSDDRESFTWIPKSQISLDQDSGVGDSPIITMPEWMATEKGFI